MGWVDLEEKLIKYWAEQLSLGSKLIQIWFKMTEHLGGMGRLGYRTSKGY